jgi:hypothetical protein
MREQERQLRAEVGLKLSGKWLQSRARADYINLSSAIAEDHFYCRRDYYIGIRAKDTYRKSTQAISFHPALLIHHVGK